MTNLFRLFCILNAKNLSREIEEFVQSHSACHSKKEHCEKRVEVETLTHLVGDGATR